jgi:predicted  nucleic acid-binding Zn-ribbon protein
MRRNMARGTIRPKISTMPRQKSEAAAFLDIYKLVVEKKRLQQELYSIDERRQQICDRLAVLEQHIEKTEATVQQIRTASEQDVNAPKLTTRPPAPSSNTFETLFLEY